MIGSETQNGVVRPKEKERKDSETLKKAALYMFNSGEKEIQLI